MSFRACLTALALAAVSIAPAARAQQTPVFRSAVDLVTVDATVVDGGGRPIEGLGPDAFELRVDGQLRRIVSVQFVSRVAPSTEAPAGASVTSRASSNDVAADRRLFLIAVDQANIRRLEGRQALQAGQRFVDSLGPSDWVSVVGVNYAGDVDFSKDRARAKRQLAALTGEVVPALVQPTFNLGLTEALWIADGNKSRLEVAVRRECGQSLGVINSPERSASGSELGRDPCPTQLEQQARATAQQVRTEASLSLNALLGLIDRLKTIDGPKTVALLSEGLIAEPRLVDLTPLGAAAQEARVSVYVLQLEAPMFDVATEQLSPTMVEDVQMQADGLARLAGAAGGALFRLAGSSAAPFNRILRELSGYYLLAFEATSTDRDGKPHRIDVSVKRSGATLRSRQAFRFGSSSGTRKLAESRLVELLRSASVAAELPLRASSYSFYEPASGKVRVEIGAETEPADGLGAEVLFGYVLLDSKGVIAASQVQENSSRRFIATARVDPGVYTLKVAAIDRFGRPGSLPRAVLAGVSNSALPASELMVARVPADPTGVLLPIIDRTSDDRILAYLELYPTTGRSLREVDVTITVRATESGAAILTMPAAISTRSERHGIARAVVPIQSLAPGRYIVRADVTGGGKAVGFVERSFIVER